MSNSKKTSTSDNNIFPNFCELASNDEKVFNVFKRNPELTAILEHVTVQEGYECFLHFKKNKEIVNILSKFNINDVHGNPVIYNYEFGNFSPSTLRYIKILSDLSQLQLNNINIVEIGGGYGGQYTVLRQFATPKSYTFIDLPLVLKLQKKYVEKNKLDDIQVNFYSSDNLPNIDADLVISNYAFSECITDIQDIYIDRVIKTSKNGYFIYNNFEGYKHEEFIKILNSKKIKTFDEKPKTGTNNVLLVW